MSNLEVGQVLILTLPLGSDIRGEKLRGKHPYIIVGIDSEAHIVELVQCSSLEGKAFEAIDRRNKVVFKENPDETVIDTDSFARLNYKITIDMFSRLAKYRRQTDKLSSTKLSGVLSAYEEYHASHTIEDDHIIYINEGRLKELN